MYNMNFKDLTIKEAREILTDREEKRLSVNLGNLHPNFGNGLNCFIVENLETKFSDPALASFLQILEIPMKLSRKLSYKPKMLRNIISFLIAEDKKHALLLSFDSEMKTVNHITEKPLLSHLRLFENCLLSLPLNQMTINMKLKEELIEIRFITGISSTPPTRKGDVLRTGVLVIAKRSSIVLGEFIFRMVCANGLIGESSDIMFHFRDNGESKVIQELSRTIGVVFENTKETLLPAFIETDKIPVDKPAQRVHRFIHEHHLPPKIESELLDRIPSLPEKSTYFDLINLFTEYARDKDNPRFENFGFNLINESITHRCSLCEQIL
ncbi:MAG: hypothetical protein KAW92_07170 [Candidatus Cloacimonetes bacterium]|nr:hypothetical protein [Candidatus Cloacimonadota bacterium]